MFKEFTTEELEFVEKATPYFIYERLIFKGDSVPFSFKISNGYGYLLRKLTMAQNDFYTLESDKKLISPICAKFRNVLRNTARSIGNDVNSRKVEGVTGDCLSPQNNSILKTYRKNQISNSLVTGFNDPIVFQSSTSNDSKEITTLRGSKKFLNYFYLNGESILIDFFVNALNPENTIWCDIVLEGYYVPEKKV
jgi:hypothetical protein